MSEDTRVPRKPRIYPAVKHEERAESEVFLELRLLDYARDAIVAAIGRSDSLDEAKQRIRDGRFTVTRSTPEAGTFVLVFLDQTDDA